MSVINLKPRIRRVFMAAAILVGLTSLTAGPAAACTCMWSGGFLKVAPNAPVIVRARISAYHPPDRRNGAMDVIVIEQWKGAAAPREIRIWGDPGNLCRPYAGQFPLGTEWILAINPQRAVDGRQEFYINGCGAYWLRVENSRAKGSIRRNDMRGAAEDESLDSVRDAIKKTSP